MKDRIIARLTEAFAPTRLEVADESELHVGHAGAAEGGHYRVLIVSAAFAGRSLVERHRLVYDALAAEMRGGIHALALVTRAPGE
jgi:BolA protein